MEQLLIPYQAVKRLDSCSILVLAPHPDDEVFGCAGAIMCHVRQGVPVRVAIVSDGGYGVSDEDRPGYVLRRQNESITAAEVMGYGSPIFWDLRDRAVVYGEKLVCRIREAIEESGADLVYAPSVFEMHPDHRALGMAAVEAVRRIGKKVRLALYEVGIPLRPNLLLDISELAERKMAAMECFVSQNEKQRYDLDIAALNRYRTYTLPPEVTAAEAYILLSAEELAKDTLKLYQSEYERQREIGLALDAKDVPLVSVIIRSMDRPTLSEALDSVALQTYPNIEVVLVNAKGVGHRDLGTWCGRFPLRMVGTEKGVQRSRAANLGLDAAKGEYLLFLDDDDWFEADHIEKLVKAIGKNPQIKGVYSGVRCVNEGNNPLPTEFAYPFDPIRLLAENYIPIHALLFSRSLLKFGCRVDESLDRCEDWDFWLQLSGHTQFLFVDGLSAVYRIAHQSGFGVSEASKKSREAEKAALAIYRKWHDDLSDDQIVNMMWAIRFNHVKDQQLQEVTHHLTLVQEQISQQQEQISQQQGQIAQQQEQIEHKLQQLDHAERQLQIVLSSRSWRITVPLRWLGVRLRRIKVIGRFLLFLVLNPSKIYRSFVRLYQDWRRGGFPAVKHTVIHLPFGASNPNKELWANYKKQLGQELEIKVREQIGRMKAKPLISILMPTYNTPAAILRETLDSVRMQLYPHWELCVSDDGSTQPEVRRVLEEYARLDARINLRFSEINTNISMATNRALELAQGEYAVLLDHDDILEKQALFRVAESILADNPDFIYSDEALISKDGSDVPGYAFRPAFSLELLRGHPYIVHLVAFRISLLRELGGLDTSLTISQDYDLILRVVEKAATIVHIPEVLYLWRQLQQSTGHEKKNQVMATSRKILERHLVRCHEAGSVEDGGSFNFFDIRYPLNVEAKVAIIIPTKNHGDLVRQCVESIERTIKHVPYEVVVVDHASNDRPSLEYFEQLRSTHRVLRYEGIFNFSAINNWAVSQLDGDFTHYLFCNNDIEAIEEGWLERMMELGQKPDIGIVGAKLFYPDNDVYQHAGVCVGMHGVAEHYGKFMDKLLPDGRMHPGYLGSLIVNHEVSAVTAACLLMRKDAFEKIGGFDEQLAVGFGDVDLCLRSRQAGYRVMFCPHAALVHHESYTRGKSREDPHPKDSAFFLQRWQPLINEGDPYFNPNLSLQDTRWDIKKPLEFRWALKRRVFKKTSLANNS